MYICIEYSFNPTTSSTGNNYYSYVVLKRVTHTVYIFFAGYSVLTAKTYAVTEKRKHKKFAQTKTIEKSDE